MDVETIATALVGAGTAYLALGLASALVLLARGLDRLDPAAKSATWGFRLIVVPGLIALWPWIARAIFTPTSPAVERNVHRDGARGSSP